MISEDLFLALRSALSSFDQKVIFTGDLAQLPPVEVGGEKGIYHDFKRHLFAIVGEIMTTVVLKDVMRQQDKKWLKMLMQVRRGVCPEGINDFLSKDYYIKSKNDADLYALCEELLKFQAEGVNAQVIAATNKMCEKINRMCQEISGVKKEDFRTYEVTSEEKPVHGNLNPELWNQVSRLIERDKAERKIKDDYKPVTLCPGQRVMIIVNEKASWEERDYINGTEGFVEALEEDGVKIRLMGSDKIVKVGYMTAKNSVLYRGFDSKMHTYTYETVRYMPVIGANAITIHRSQGQTAEIMYVDPRGCKQPGHMYVALSRTTTPEGIRLLAPIDPKYVVADPHVTAYYDFIYKFNVGYGDCIIRYLEDRFKEADRCIQIRKETESLAEFGIPELLDAVEKISYKDIQLGSDDDIVCLALYGMLFDSLYNYDKKYCDPRLPYIMAKAIETESKGILELYVSGRLDRILNPEAYGFPMVEKPDVPLTHEDAYWELMVMGIDENEFPDIEFDDYEPADNEIEQMYLELEEEELEQEQEYEQDDNERE